MQQARVPGTLGTLRIAALLVLLSPMFPLITAAKTLMIFAPHPDDEALMASGIMYSALSRGDTVKVVVMTNGDAGAAPPGTSLGTTRQGETVTGMSTLGLSEQNIIFLGYGDGMLMQLQNSSFPTAIYTSYAGQTQTYASRGLGGTDYHNYLNQVHGAYNQATLFVDVKAVLQNFKPDEIYTTASWDAHPDHQATGLFVAQAILALRKSGVSFSPKLYETIIHAPSDGYKSIGPSFWPAPILTPLVPIPVPRGLVATPLDWNQVINFPVSAVMQDPNPSTNLKEQVISAYQNQLIASQNWLYSFVKKNEFFWLYNYSTNVALNATVTDSSEASGQPGTAAINGVVDGFPNNWSQEWATTGQLAGAWIQLNWAQSITTSLIVLHDRPNTTDNVRAGTLSFSDRSTINVGTLPDNGDGLSVSFGRKTITWVKFTVNQAVGLNIGLSEIEVYGTVANSTTNYGPQISYGPLANPSVVNSSDSSNLSVTAFDVNGNTLQYSWTADNGTIQGNGSTATFFPPASSSNPVFTITAAVDDGNGLSASNSAFVSANVPSTLALNPATVLGGASSQGTVTLLGPAPASGAVITLLNGNTSLATVPSSVTVPGNAISADFTVNTVAVTATMQVTIAASYGGQTQAARLTVNPIVPTSITLSPASLTFANQNVGTASSAQMVILSNTGNAPLSISKVSISDGFAQSNNCGNSLAAQSNCSFGVTFVPTAPGSANGQLKIEDNASGSPHVVSLTGTALGPVVSLSGNSLTFTGQVVGMTSGSQTLTLANTGNAPLTISNLAAAGDFAVATAGTNCSASSPVAAAGKCTISVTFTPTTSGNRTGTLTIVDNASGSPHDVALSGMGEDFSLGAASGSSISATVSSGQSATYIVSITPVDGFNQAVVLMCSGAPSEATCSISPSSVTLSGSNATNSTVTVTTTAPSRVAPRGHTDPPLSGLGGPVPLLSLWLLALTLSLLGVAERQRARLILTGIAALVVMWAACGGGGAPGRGGGGNPGTPQGTYTLALTGSFTSGATSVKHDLSLILKVD